MKIRELRNIQPNEFSNSLHKKVYRIFFFFSLLSIAINYYIFSLFSSLLGHEINYEFDHTFIEFFSITWLIYWCFYLSCGVLIIKLIQLIQIEEWENTRYIKKYVIITTINGFIGMIIIQVIPFIENLIFQVNVISFILSLGILVLTVFFLLIRPSLFRYPDVPEAKREKYFLYFLILIIFSCCVQIHPTGFVLNQLKIFLPLVEDKNFLLLSSLLILIFPLIYYVLETGKKAKNDIEHFMSKEKKDGSKILNKNKKRIKNQAISLILKKRISFQ